MLPPDRRGASEGNSQIVRVRVTHAEFAIPILSIVLVAALDFLRTNRGDLVRHNKVSHDDS
jgi:hypothetical protein